MDGIELSPSDRAKCRSCGKKIGLKTPRGYRIDEKYHGGHINYCYDCSFRIIDNQIDELKKMKVRLKKLIKENQKAIVLENL